LPTSEFSGIPFVAGSIRGERCWSIRNGELKSPQQHFFWKGGENRSDCARNYFEGFDLFDKVSRLFPNKYVLSIQITTSNTTYVHTPFSVDKTFYSSNLHSSTFDDPAGFCEVVWEDNTRHEVMVSTPTTDMWKSRNNEKAWIEISREMVNMKTRGTTTISLAELKRVLGGHKSHEFSTCTCGFYAFLNGHNRYADTNPVVGIIEGYGETVIGTRGFRSKKAKILALAPVVPFELEKEPEEEPQGDPIFAVDLANLSDEGFKKYGFVSGRRAGKASITYRQNVLKEAVSPSISPQLWENLKKNYPEIVFFNNPDIMRKEFPATNVDEIL
jgi:hypothetical protein